MRRLNTFLCIIKIRVTGAKERHDSRPVFIDPFQQLQACTVRHLDIRQHQRDFWEDALFWVDSYDEEELEFLAESRYLPYSAVQVRQVPHEIPLL